MSAERTACETQFYDYSPSNPRYGIWIRDDERISSMATLQFQATDNLDFFVEAQVALSLFVEGKNLTAETERSTSGDMRMGEMWYSGKRYFAGASIKF